MSARDPSEAHRAATPLELFYDLVSVIAIAAAASLLHHGLANNHVFEATLLFFMTFWSIWWAWMNFTWFASAYDSDDVIYRVAVFVQIVGALIMAAGIQQLAEEQDFRPVFVGFVIMRISLVSLWLRAAHSDPRGRGMALRNGFGIALCQVGWAILVFVVPSAYLYIGFVVMLVFEHLVPVVAERAATSTWHRGHIIERYGLLTIIVLGESMLAVYVGIQAVIKQVNGPLVSSLFGGVLILFSMWWLYFQETEHQILKSAKGAFLWGYGHFTVFASIAAVGAGLAVVIDQWQGNTAINLTLANTCVVVPVAIYLLGLLFLHEISKLRMDKSLLLYLYSVVIVLILITPIFQYSVVMVGVILTVFIYLQHKMRTEEVSQ